MSLYSDVTLDRIEHSLMEAHKLEMHAFGRNPDKYSSSHSETANAIKYLRAKLAKEHAASASILVGPKPSSNK
jgi:hypothetical protein